MFARRRIGSPEDASDPDRELVLWLRTLTSAAVYPTLIVTFGFQVARVEGRSMEPTLHDQDRLVVNKFAYQVHDPEVGDVVMLLHPNNPGQSLVKRVIAARHRVAGTRVLAMLVLVGCVYWLLNAVENIAFLVWSPLSPTLFGALSRAGIPDVFVSVTYGVVAVIVAIVIARANPFELGTRFGVVRE